MNNSIAIIAEGNQNLADEFGFIRIEYLQMVTDQKIDEWIKHFFSKYPDIEKIIIPVRLGKDDSDYTGLRVGLHIRLTKELGKKRLIPIMFLSEQTRNEIIGNQIFNSNEKTSLLLFTPGVKLIGSFDLNKETIEGFNNHITEEDLKSQVLPKLLITNQREQGHQLANEWGVFRLAKFAGIELTSIKLPTDLYFKHQFSKTTLNIQPHGNTKIGLQIKGCNALLIDDNANEGWKEVLEHILKSNINLYSSKLDILTTYKDAVAYEDYESKDIIFLDLRLKPEEDRASESLPLEELSGLKLLHKIKGINKGIQVIILTASNKAWNMKALLDAGADGYFIKESPEIPVSDNASKMNYDNLVKAIKEALDKGYLKEIDKIHKKATEFIDIDYSTKNTNYQLFYDRSRSSLDIAFELLKYASKDNKYFNLAYLTYYQILEDYTSQIENFEFVSTTECYVDNRTKRVISLSSSARPEWSLKYVKDRNGNYFQRTIIENEFKVESLAKISFVLAFKHHKDNTYLKSFGKIHQLRNTKAAHGGGSYITIPEIKEILDVVKLFFSQP